MQKSNPFPHRSLVPFPYCLSEALARAYLRAREATAGTPPSASDIFSAYARSLEPDQATDPSAVIGEDPDTVGGQVDLAELLGVMREPIAWVFSLAERRAKGDLVDLAGIHRVRDAVLHRVDAIVAEAAPADAPRIRAADLWTVASLLVGSVDPATVQWAAQIIHGGISKALSALPPVPAIGAEFASTLHTCNEPRAQGWGSSRPHFHYIPRTEAPFVGRYAGPLDDAHLLRVAVPLRHWLQSLLVF